MSRQARVAVARAARERPFLDEHRASRQRRRFLPVSFEAMVRWWVQGYRAELPDEMHQDGIWRDRKRIGDAKEYEPVGGSATGAPRDAEPFASYIYDPASRHERAESQGKPEEQPSYASPMRWTAEFLERKHPLIAAVLRAIARSGDWRGIGMTCTTCSSRITLPDEFSEAIARDALRLAREHYLEEPKPKPVTWIDKSEAQQRAEGAA